MLSSAMLRSLLLFAGFVLALLPAPDAGAQQAQSIAADVKRVADWVRREGNVSKLDAQWLVPFGIGPESLGVQPTRNFSYEFKEDGGATYAFSLLTVNGAEIMLVARFVPDEMLGWRINAQGTALVSLRRDGAGAISTLPASGNAVILQRVVRGLSGIAASKQ
jgi:hypothetical protein